MADPANPRPRRILRVVLVLSLALNLAFVGIVAGFAWRGGRDGPPHGMELSLGPVGEALSKQERRDILDTLRRNRDLRALRRGPAREGVATMVAALQTEPFDAAAFSDSLTMLESRQVKLRDAVREAFLVQVSRMSPAERASFAQRLQEAVTRRH